MQAYDTVADALHDLSKRGYTATFNLRNDCLYCHENDIRLNIDELYRFEGNTDPSDESIIYAISSVDGSMKGILVNAYGVYGDTGSEELISKLKIKRQ